MLILFHRQNMLYSLMMCFLCSFWNQNNWPWTFPHWCQNGLADWEHTIHIANRNGSTLFSYFWLKVTMPSTQNIEQTKHMTVMVRDALSENSYMLGVMMGWAGVVYICTVWTLKQGQTLRHTSIGWLGQSRNYWHCTMLSQTASLWSESEELESITRHSVILDATI